MLLPHFGFPEYISAIPLGRESIFCGFMGTSVTFRTLCRSDFLRLSCAITRDPDRALRPFCPDACLAVLPCCPDPFLAVPFRGVAVAVLAAAAVVVLAAVAAVVVVAVIAAVAGVVPVAVAVLAAAVAAADAVLAAVAAVVVVAVVAVVAGVVPVAVAAAAADLVAVAEPAGQPVENAAALQPRAAGSGNSRIESNFAVLPHEDSVPPNTAADRAATVRGVGQSGDPIGPNRFDAVPSHGPNDHPNVAARRHASRENTPEARGSNVPECAAQTVAHTQAPSTATARCN